MNSNRHHQGERPIRRLPQSRRWGDRLAKTSIAAGALTVLAVFVWMAANIVIQGASGFSWSYLVSAPRKAGLEGGIGPILVSTLLILGVCLAAAIPIGLGTAMLLAEYTARESLLGRALRRSLDALAGAPSIVFGLFGNAFFCVFLGMGFSILSGGLTLACMVLPILIRTAEASLRSTPEEYRTGAAALGLSRATTLMKLQLPAAAPGLAAGVILGVGRALAETAALIFTSGYVDRLPTSLFDSGRSLSVHVYDMAFHMTGGFEAAYRAALVLIGLLAGVQLITRLILDRWLGGRLLPS